MTDFDREQLQERINVQRVLGGMLLIVSLLLYFFHLAEVALGDSLLGVLAGLFAAVGAALLWVGRCRLRALR